MTTESKEYPLHSIEGPEATTLADLESIHTDLKFVMDILTKWLTEQNDDTTVFALFSSALVTYRRCFNSGVRQALRSSDVAPIGNGALDFHEYLLAQANKLIAHSVNPFEKTQVGVIVIDGVICGVGTFHGRLVAFDKGGVEQWGSLVKTLANTVLLPRIEAARKAVDTAARQLPISQIIGSPILSWSVPSPDAAGKRRR